MQVKTWLARHAVPVAFVLAYAVTWTSIVLIVGPQGLAAGTVSTPQFMLIWVAMLAGSGGVGLALTALLEGRAGLADLLAGMRKWRVGARWYAPLLITPLAAAGVLALLVPTSPAFVPTLFAAPDKRVPLLMFVVVAFGTFVEELGWTGFVTRRLRGRLSPLALGLVVGVLWGAWHFLGDFTGSRALYGPLFPLHFLTFWLIPLTTFRVLIVWVYDHTESLLLAQLMHASYSPVLFVLGPAAASATQSVTYESLFTLALVVVTAVLVARDRRRAPTPQPRAV